MKNLQTFEEFLNESRLTEKYGSLVWEFTMKIGTKKFLFEIEFKTQGTASSLYGYDYVNLSEIYLKANIKKHLKDLENFPNKNKVEVLLYDYTPIDYKCNLQVLLNDEFELFDGKIPAPMTK